MSIRDYWIKEIQNIEEFKAIADAVDPEIINLTDEVKNLIDDQFIETATNKGIARREKLLKIQPFSDDTLDTRKFRVGVEWNNQVPYSYRQLEKKLSDLLGEDGYMMSRNLGNHKLTIKVNLGQKRMLQSVDNTVQNIAPCNLIITVELQYNRHIDLARFTHEYLATKTHLQLREEALQ